MSAILDIYMTRLWHYAHLPGGSFPQIQPEVVQWWKDHIGRDHVRMIAREVQVHNRDGVRNSYRVFLLFKDDASLIHFRLRWGGNPVEEMPASRSTIYE